MNALNIMLELLLALTAAGSAVTLCLLLLRTLPDEAMSARWRYRLGKLALAFYLLPISLLAARLTPPSASPAASDAAAFAGAASEAAAGINRTGPELPLWAAAGLLGIWAAGALGYAAWQLIAYRKFARLLRASSLPVPAGDEAHARLRRVRRELGLKREVALAYSPMLRGPILAGLLRPAVYLPTPERGAISGAALDMALRHELIHLRRGDLRVKLLALAACALHWFNPLAHLARRDLGLWSELACDAEAVANMSREERKLYGLALIGAAGGPEGRPSRFVAPLSGDGHQLQRRLSLMLNVTKIKKKTAVISTAAVLAIAALGTTAAAWASENTPTVSEAVPVASVPEKGVNISEDSISVEPATRASSSEDSISVEPATRASGSEDSTSVEPATRASGSEDSISVEPATRASGSEDSISVEPATRASSSEDSVAAEPAARANDSGSRSASEPAPVPSETRGSASDQAIAEASPVRPAATSSESRTVPSAASTEPAPAERSASEQAAPSVMPDSARK
ncbi:hypothetical protein CDO73_22265 [Saccharibacillus sp. O23]|uniref:M56 family metallopeptidase n=1 Tax=Saccharibacillus sp. O23 TaxID=2009338 RepID=UPI000B4DF374|nr:M56 family metallopeptidase [Saccharibacillus sp. O23]OWR27349.1 hypothetical protein CDO73_22265 [Saccharibacillus sp. O23]